MGYKTCKDCKINKPLSEFYRDSSCVLGVKNRCKDCQKPLNKEWHEKTTAEPKKKAERLERQRNYDKKRVRPMSQQSAHQAVAFAIKRGKLQRLDGTVKCVDCGDIATQYDHRHYDNPLEVDPVCASCNARRGHALDVEYHPSAFW